MTDTITAVELVETEYGEKVVLESPYEARDYIKYAPWGSDDGVEEENLDESVDFEFSDDFGCYREWDADELGGSGAWLVRASTFPEFRDYLESVGYDVTTNVEIDDVE